MERVGLEGLLEGLGFNGRQRAVVKALILGRIRNGGRGGGCASAALGEVLEVDFETMSLMRLYRVSDDLMAHREARNHLFIG